MRLAALVLCVIAIVGCPSAKHPAPARAQVRGAVLAMADAVELADKLCALTVRGLRADGKAYGLLASKCIEGYDLARAGLIDAEDALDVLDEIGSSDAAMSKIGCAAGSIMGGLSTTATALDKAGVHIPARVEDALSLGHWIGEAVGGSCAYRSAYEDGGTDAAGSDMGGNAPGVLAPADAGAAGG